MGSWDAIFAAVGHLPTWAWTAAVFLAGGGALAWYRRSVAKYIPHRLAEGLANLSPYGWPVAGAFAVLALVYFVMDVERLRAVPHLTFEPPIQRPVGYALGDRFDEIVLPVVNWPVPNGEHVTARGAHAEMRALEPTQAGLGPLRWSDVAQLGNGAKVARDIELTDIVSDNKARTLSLFMRKANGDVFITNSFAVTNGMAWQMPELKLGLGLYKFDVRVCAENLSDPCPVAVIEVGKTKDRITANLAP